MGRMSNGMPENESFPVNRAPPDHTMRQYASLCVKESFTDPPHGRDVPTLIEFT